MNIDEIQNQYEWNDLVAGFNGSLVFHTFQWLEVLEKTFAQRKLLLCFKDESDTVVGIFPLMTTKKAIFNISASPLRGTTGYMGPRLNGIPMSDFMTLFNRYCLNRKYDYVEVTFPEATDASALRSQGFQSLERLTYRLLLDESEDALWNNLDSKCRNMIRKAEKHGVVIMDGTINDIDDYYEMLCQSFAKHNTKPSVSKVFIKNAYECLIADGMIKFLFASINGKKISGAIFLLYNKHVYFWSGAALSEYNKYAPNNLLQWNLIKWACNNNFVIYDMAGKGIKSIDHFKESFGAQALPYCYAWKSYSCFAGISRYIYKTIAFARRGKFMRRF